MISFGIEMILAAGESLFIRNDSKQGSEEVRRALAAV